MRNLLTLHLSLIDGVGPATIAQLQKHPAYAELYSCNAADIVREYNVSRKSAELIAAGLKDVRQLEDELQLMQRYGIAWVTSDDERYPALLKEIDCPPSVLYYRGADLHTFKKNIAIIGSRKAEQYAQNVIAACVPPLIQSGWDVMSGGALGADTMAHKQTVACGGRTVAILGSGLLRPHPTSNKKLFEDIIASGGAVVSSFKLQEPAYPGNFPARNRIIAGMSQACLVVQAAERSGASITANFALNQGRHVLAVPGSIFDPLSAGCHALIKEGATPIASPADLLIELGEKPLEPEVQMTIQDTAIEPTAIKEKKVSLNAQKTPYIPELSENATIGERILFYCKEPVSTEELLEHIAIDIDLLHDHLFDLQLAGRLEQNATGLWQLIS